MIKRPASSALSRFKVIDLTRVRSGPTAVRQLADWGADVVKIETPEHMEPDGAVGAPRGSSDFQNLQRNKRSLTLNLKDPDGLDVFKRLMKRADVVVENFRPDVKTRLGVDYDSLRAINPGLVYASISGFGQEGPYSKNPGLDHIAQGMGGLMSITGAPGQGPMRVGIPIADLTAGIFCAFGILVALLEREASGVGQWVQTSLLQAQIFMLDFQAARWLVEREVPKQAGNNHPTHIPTGVFETRDGMINVAVAGDTTWQRFCKVLEAEEWIAHPDYATGTARLKNRDVLNEKINERLKSKDSATWIELLNEAGVPSGEIYSIDKMFADPQVKYLSVSQEIESARFGKIELLRQPVQLSRTPSQLTVAPPERGEHTDEILGDLGYSAHDIANFRQRHVV